MEKTMNLDIQKLRSAITAAKYLSLSEAAYNMNFTPSAISKHIKSLEDELGIVLFERHGRSGVSLTNEGRMVLPILQKVMADLDELDGTIRSMSDSPVFWLGTAPIFPTRITSAFVTRLAEHMPEVRPRILHHDNKTLIELVCMGRLDAGISNILGKLENNPEFVSIKNKNLILKPIVTEEEVVLLNVNHPLARKPELKMDDLLFDPNNTFMFINPTPTVLSPRQIIFNNECRRRGIRTRTKVIDLEVGIAAETVKRRIGSDVHYVAFYPPINKTPRNVVCKHCVDNIFESRIVIFYMKNNRSRRLKAFIEGAESIIQDGRID
jgi:DNA-binding transcriptional LysR family regulator